ncbi:TauD/TfdA family dioxygenase [Streptomyces lydicus]|uniref:TauD/TfdA family dioxygenase n=1 Tax=Streptomyces lydicus TaxID=47763 RepID=UPI001F512295|nr:TauD/TfdA family dioxygenase [Streptomyces lydicus]MCZ1006983.1 TauD/TfdA family dioxygenase [Streptomyces lydicus]
MASQESWTPLDIEPEGVGGPEELIERLGAMTPAEMSRLLTEEKAIAFRGFDIPADTLDDVLDRVLPHRIGGALRPARERYIDDVWSVGREQPHMAVRPYNEMSSTHAWPGRIALYCHTAPATGGPTMVVDGAIWLASLTLELRERFAPGVRYVRYLHDGVGFGVSWQRAFVTTRRDDVEVFLDGTGTEWRWTADGGIHISRVRPAVVTHPVTGADVWFNQVHRWHPAGRGPGDVLSRSLSADQRPWNVTLADGSAILTEEVTQICESAARATVDIPWGRGDLLLLDNVALAHGRRPFTGTRRVRVGMAH